MLKKVLLILFCCVLMVSCSEDTSKDVVEMKEPVIAQEESKKESEEKPVASSTDSSTKKPELTYLEMTPADEVVYNAVNACHAFIPDTHVAFAEAKADNYNLFKIQDTYELAVKAHQCVLDNFEYGDSPNEHVVYSESLDAFAEAVTKLIFFKNEMELFLENRKLITLSNASQYDEEMFAEYQEFADIFVRESKAAGLGN